MTSSSNRVVYWGTGRRKTAVARVRIVPGSGSVTINGTSTGGGQLHVATALTIAIYSDYIFDDRSLYECALRDHAQADLTLLTSLDLAWTADGLQRDGPHVREPVDQLIRQALQHHQLPYNVVAGRGVARVQHALSAIEHLMDAPQRQLRAASSPRWRWYCDHCDDGECEQHGLGDVRG
mgnify:CR=1 FL=1